MPKRSRSGSPLETQQPERTRSTNPQLPVTEAPWTLSRHRESGSAEDANASDKVLVIPTSPHPSPLREENLEEMDAPSGSDASEEAPSAVMRPLMTKRSRREYNLRPRQPLPSQSLTRPRRPCRQRPGRRQSVPYCTLPYFTLPEIKVDRDSKEAKELAKLVAPTKEEPPRGAPSCPKQAKGFQIVKEHQDASEDKVDVENEKENKKRWKWRDIPLLPPSVMRRKKKKNVKVEYPSHWISPKGFTWAEHQVCEMYLTWRSFEYHFPIPKRYRALKVFIDQIRRTKGYGVTVPRPYPFRGPNFIPYGTDWQKSYTLNIHMTRMVLNLVLSMRKEFKNFRPAGLKLTNSVFCSASRVYLLSHVFEPQMITRKRKRSHGEEEVAVNVVQSMFDVIQFPGLHLHLAEWKLRRGSKLVYSTSSTKGGEKFVKSIYDKYFAQYFAPKQV